MTRITNTPLPDTVAPALPHRVALPLADMTGPALPEVAPSHWPRHQLGGDTMGTTWAVQAYAPPDCPARVLRAAIQAALDDCIALFSNWSADSVISRLNAAPAGHWPCPPDVMALLARSQALAAATQGAVDPTLGALIELWGFGATGPRAYERCGLPTAAEIDTALAASGWRRLTLDIPSGRVSKPAGLILDLCGIAKGWAVDRVSAQLRALGARTHLVEIGGELKGCGLKPDLQPWWVDLEPVPDAEHPTPAVRVALVDGAIATSGDYRRHVHWAGTRLSHTLDGRTGRPVDNGVASVSVLHADAMMADAYATAVLVLGVEAGLRLADSLSLPVRLMQRDGTRVTEHLSAALRTMMDDDA